MSPSSSPLIFPILQCFLCAVRRGLLIHLVFLLLCALSHTAKNEHLQFNLLLSCSSSPPFFLLFISQKKALFLDKPVCGAVFPSTSPFWWRVSFSLTQHFSVNDFSSLLLQLCILHYNLYAISLFFLHRLVIMLTVSFSRFSRLSIVNTDAKWNGFVISERFVCSNHKSLCVSELCV